MKLQSSKFYRIPSKEEILQLYVAPRFEMFDCLFRNGKMYKKEDILSMDTMAFKDRIYSLIKDKEIEKRNIHNEYFYRYIDYLIGLYDIIYKYILLSNKKELSYNEYKNLISCIAYFDYMISEKLDFDIFSK